MTEFAKLCGSNAPHILMFIGGGNMASALVDGCIKSGFISVNQIAISCRSKNTNDKWKSKGFSNVFTSNSEMLSSFPGGILVLSIKPQMRDSVYESLRGSVLLNGISLVISLLAGIDIDVLRKELILLGYTGPIVRLMPNTPAAIGAGSSVVCSSSGTASWMLDLVKGLASKIGMCLEIDAKSFNAASAIAGCGPAWVYMFIESLADGGVLSGCSRETAMKLAAQTVMGAAKMVLESGEHPASLKDKVCSPAGTSIVGLRQLEKAGFRSAIIEAVKSASDRANSL